MKVVWCGVEVKSWFSSHHMIVPEESGKFVVIQKHIKSLSLSLLRVVPIDLSRYIKPPCYTNPHAPTPSLCQVCPASRLHTYAQHGCGTHTQRLEQTDAWLIRHSSPGDSAGGARHSCRNVMSRCFCTHVCVLLRVCLSRRPAHLSENAVPRKRLSAFS